MESGRDDFAALRTILSGIEQDIEQICASVAEAVRHKTIPDEDSDTFNINPVEEIATAWVGVQQDLVILAAAIGASVDKAIMRFDQPPANTTVQRLQTFVRGFWKRQSRRKESSTEDVLRIELANANDLYGLLQSYRGQLVATRHSLESNLVELTSHRSDLVDHLCVAKEPDGKEHFQSVLTVERYLQVIADVIRELNAQLGSANILINKLAIEAERMVLLIGILARRQDRSVMAPILFDKAALPHVVPLIELYDRGMLASVEIERRKTAIESRFFESYGDLLDNDARTDYVKTTNAEVGHA